MSFRWLFIIGAFIAANDVRATPPDYAVLVDAPGAECERAFAETWLREAEEEAARVLSTLNGGFLEPSCQVAANAIYPRHIDPVAVPMNTLLCIDVTKLPDDCAFGKCNYTGHPELHEDECPEDESDDDKDAPHKNHKRSDYDKAACRKLSSWLSIAIKKLDLALNEFDAERFTSAVSASCVAELIFGRIAHKIDDLVDSEKLAYINEFARRSQCYNFTNGPSRVDEYTAGGTNVTQVSLRTIQVLRSCRAHPFELTSMVLLSRSDGNSTVREQSQLVWAVAGTLPPFAATINDHSNLCVRSGAPSDQVEFLADRRFPNLTSQDSVVVQGDGVARPYYDISAASECPLVVLLKDLKENNKTVVSAAQLNMRRPIAARSAADLDAILDDEIFLRVATGDVCTDLSSTFVDVESNTIVSLAASRSASSASIERPRAGIPLTLPPGASICVGGTRAGSSCSQASECGAGRACRRKPFSRNVAYCFDGVEWDEADSCAFADSDDPCPFGECVGDANGLDGGAYPFMYFYQSNACGTSGATEVCKNEHVANWKTIRNEAAFW